jgi:beta-galactosidase
MGLNAVSAYVFWNFHERQPGQFDFEGQADIKHFSSSVILFFVVNSAL